MGDTWTKCKVVGTLQNKTKILLIKALNGICKNSLSIFCENIGNFPLCFRIIFRAIVDFIQQFDIL